MNEHARIRVVRAVSPGTVLKVGMALGILCGLIGGWLHPALGYYGIISPQLPSSVAIAIEPWRGAIFVPGILLALVLGCWWSNRCPSSLVGFAIAATFAASEFWTIIWVTELYSTTFAEVGLFALDLVLWGGLSAVMVGSFGGSLFLGLRFINTRIGCQVVIQDGFRCEECGYVLRGLRAGSRCPECGVEPTTGVRVITSRGRFARFIGKRSTSFLVAVVLSLVIVSVPPLWSGRQTGILLGQLAPPQSQIEPLDGAILIFDEGKAGGVIFASGFYFPVDEALGRTVMVFAHPPEGDWTNRVQIRLGFTTTTAEGARFTEESNPMILCNLDSTETAFVVAHGIPSCLFERLLSESERIGAVPSSTGTSAGLFRQPVEVDATGCFEN